MSKLLKELLIARPYVTVPNRLFGRLSGNGLQNVNCTISPDRHNRHNSVNDHSRSRSVPARFLDSSYSTRTQYSTSLYNNNEVAKNINPYITSQQYGQYYTKATQNRVKFKKRITFRIRQKRLLSARPVRKKVPSNYIVVNKNKGVFETFCVETKKSTDMNMNIPGTSKDDFNITDTPMYNKIKKDPNIGFSYNPVHKLDEFRYQVDATPKRVQKMKRKNGIYYGHKLRKCTYLMDSPVIRKKTVRIVTSMRDELLRRKRSYSTQDFTEYKQNQLEMLDEIFKKKTSATRMEYFPDNYFFDININRDDFNEIINPDIVDYVKCKSYTSLPLNNTETQTDPDVKCKSETLIPLNKLELQTNTDNASKLFGCIMHNSKQLSDSSQYVPQRNFSSENDRSGICKKLDDSCTKNKCAGKEECKEAKPCCPAKNPCNHVKKNPCILRNECGKEVSTLKSDLTKTTSMCSSKESPNEYKPKLIEPVVQAKPVPALDKTTRKYPAEVYIPDRVKNAIVVKKPSGKPPDCEKCLKIQENKKLPPPVTDLDRPKSSPLFKPDNIVSGLPKIINVDEVLGKVSSTKDQSLTTNNLVNQRSVTTKASSEKVSANISKPSKEEKDCFKKKTTVEASKTDKSLEPCDTCETFQKNHQKWTPVKIETVRDQLIRVAAESRKLQESRSKLGYTSQSLWSSIKCPPNLNASLPVMPKPRHELMGGLKDIFRSIKTVFTKREKEHKEPMHGKSKRVIKCNRSPKPCEDFSCRRNKFHTLSNIVGSCEVTNNSIGIMVPQIPLIKEYRRSKSDDNICKKGSLLHTLNLQSLKLLEEEEDMEPKNSSSKCEKSSDLISSDACGKGKCKTLTSKDCKKKSSDKEFQEMCSKYENKNECDKNKTEEVCTKTSKPSFSEMCAQFENKNDCDEPVTTKVSTEDSKLITKCETDKKNKCNKSSKCKSDQSNSCDQRKCYSTGPPQYSTSYSNLNSMYTTSKKYEMYLNQIMKQYYSTIKKIDEPVKNILSKEVAPPIKKDNPEHKINVKGYSSVVYLDQEKDASALKLYCRKSTVIFKESETQKNYSYSVLSKIPNLNDCEVLCNNDNKTAKDICQSKDPIYIKPNKRSNCIKSSEIPKSKKPIGYDIVFMLREFPPCPSPCPPPPPPTVDGVEVISGKACENDPTVCCAEPEAKETPEEAEANTVTLVDKKPKCLEALMKELKSKAEKEALAKAEESKPAATEEDPDSNDVECLTEIKNEFGYPDNFFDICLKIEGKRLEYPPSYTKMCNKIKSVSDESEIKEPKPCKTKSVSDEIEVKQTKPCKIKTASDESEVKQTKPCKTKSVSDKSKVKSIKPCKIKSVSEHMVQNKKEKETAQKCPDNKVEYPDNFNEICMKLEGKHLEYPASYLRICNKFGSVKNNAKFKPVKQKKPEQSLKKICNTFMKDQKLKDSKLKNTNKINEECIKPKVETQPQPCLKQKSSVNADEYPDKFHEICMKMEGKRQEYPHSFLKICNALKPVCVERKCEPTTLPHKTLPVRKKSRTKFEYPPMFDDICLALEGKQQEYPPFFSKLCNQFDPLKDKPKCKDSKDKKPRKNVKKICKKSSKDQLPEDDKLEQSNDTKLTSENVEPEVQCKLHTSPKQENNANDVEYPYTFVEICSEVEGKKQEYSQLFMKICNQFENNKNKCTDDENTTCKAPSSEKTEKYPEDFLKLCNKFTTKRDSKESDCNKVCKKPTNRQHHNQSCNNTPTSSGLDYPEGFKKICSQFSKENMNQNVCNQISFPYSLKQKSTRYKGNPDSENYKNIAQSKSTSNEYPEIFLKFCKKFECPATENNSKVKKYSGAFNTICNKNDVKKESDSATHGGTSAVEKNDVTTMCVKSQTKKQTNTNVFKSGGALKKGGSLQDICHPFSKTDPVKNDGNPPKDFIEICNELREKSKPENASDKIPIEKTDTDVEYPDIFNKICKTFNAIEITPEKKCKSQSNLSTINKNKDKIVDNDLYSDEFNAICAAISGVKSKQHTYPKNFRDICKPFIEKKEQSNDAKHSHVDDANSNSNCRKFSSDCSINALYNRRLQYLNKRRFSNDDEEESIYPDEFDEICNRISGSKGSQKQYPKKFRKMCEKFDKKKCPPPKRKCPKKPNCRDYTTSNNKFQFDFIENHSKHEDKCTRSNKLKGTDEKQNDLAASKYKSLDKLNDKHLEQKDVCQDEKTGNKLKVDQCPESSKKLNEKFINKENASMPVRYEVCRSNISDTSINISGGKYSKNCEKNIWFSNLNARKYNDIINDYRKTNNSVCFKIANNVKSQSKSKDNIFSNDEKPNLLNNDDLINKLAIPKSTELASKFINKPIHANASLRSFTSCDSHGNNPENFNKLLDELKEFKQNQNEYSKKFESMSEFFSKNNKSALKKNFWYSNETARIYGDKVQGTLNTTNGVTTTSNTTLPQQHNIQAANIPTARTMSFSNLNKKNSYTTKCEDTEQKMAQQNKNKIRDTEDSYNDTNEMSKFEENSTESFGQNQKVANKASKPYQEEYNLYEFVAKPEEGNNEYISDDIGSLYPKCSLNKHPKIANSLSKQSHIQDNCPVVHINRVKLQEQEQIYPTKPDKISNVIETVNCDPPQKPFNCGEDVEKVNIKNDCLKAEFDCEHADAKYADKSFLKKCLEACSVLETTDEYEYPKPKHSSAKPPQQNYFTKLTCNDTGRKVANTLEEVKNKVRLVLESNKQNTASKNNPIIEIGAFPKCYASSEEDSSPEYGGPIIDEHSGADTFRTLEYVMKCPTSKTIMEDDENYENLPRKQNNEEIDSKYMKPHGTDKNMKWKIIQHSANISYLNKSDNEDTEQKCENDDVEEPCHLKKDASKFKQCLSKEGKCPDKCDKINKKNRSMGSNKKSKKDKKTPYNLYTECAKECSSENNLAMKLIASNQEAKKKRKEPYNLYSECAKECSSDNDLEMKLITSDQEDKTSHNLYSKCAKGCSSENSLGIKRKTLSSVKSSMKASEYDPENELLDNKTKIQYLKELDAKEKKEYAERERRAYMRLLCKKCSHPDDDENPAYGYICKQPELKREDKNSSMSKCITKKIKFKYVPPNLDDKYNEQE